MTRSRPRCLRSRRCTSGTLLDREGALHASLPVARDGAVELVLAGLERQGEARVGAGDRVADLLDAVALDLDVVRDLGVVRQVDRDLAGGRGELGLVEGERAARI